ncbi:sigma-70 family RNA polymerase sigma factor [Lignipirellula cremea]|uniref:RNA polymerase sigma factor CarQ n=1 Tax=Lignipirellula cremea TaxID=2528010 RepID=A0A518DN84_9BACT|nr:sigma-70 family RNA polymerase sigma factor [Lignipirellula cremea]QDU93298.1 RNA polymerase sigma factor CarQ [Lignipirellula cremea]
MTESSPSSSEEASADAFVTLLVQHRHALYAFIAKQLVNPADVEDVFQKTSLVLWKKMEQFDPAGRFFPWACGVAFNEVRNFLSVQRNSRLHFDAELVALLAEEAAAEDALSQARLSVLQECLAKLSDRQQEILRRCYMGTESITDVAERLGRERGALYKQLARLKEKLLECMRPRLAAWETDR